MRVRSLVGRGGGVVQDDLVAKGRASEAVLRRHAATGPFWRYFSQGQCVLSTATVTVSFAVPCVHFPPDQLLKTG